MERIKSFMFTFAEGIFKIQVCPRFCFPLHFKFRSRLNKFFFLSKINNEYFGIVNKYRGNNEPIVI